MSMKKCGFAATLGVVLFLLTACVCLTSVHAQEPAVSSTMTLDNLMTAYNGEKNANVRYAAFAKKASEEGYEAAASLFKAAAAAEQVHYERHAKVIRKLGGTPKAEIEIPVVNSTRENITAAFKGETYESEVMYPAFIKQAKKEGDKEALDAFEDAGAAEDIHAKLYARMLKNLDLSKSLAKDFYVCPVCGNIVDVITGTMCPICYTDTKKFTRVR